MGTTVADCLQRGQQHLGLSSAHHAPVAVQDLGVPVHRRWREGINTDSSNKQSTQPEETMLQFYVKIPSRTKTGYREAGTM